MEHVKKFINAIDRYVEVSYVYSQRMKEDRSDQSQDRLNKLIELLEKAEIDEDCEKLQPIDTSEIKGQNVVASQYVFEETRCYQNVIKERLDSGVDSYNSLSTHNQGILRKLIDMEPEQCLASFKTVSYAWDILTEFASLSLLPSSEKLAAADMIHMHLIELRKHLFRVVAYAKMLSPDSLLELRGEYTVKQLNKWEEKGKLVESLVTESMHMETNRLLEEVHIYTGKYPEMFKIVAQKEERVKQRLEQESRGYPDILEENLNMEKAENLCDMLVLYGLGVGYITWLSFAEKNETSYNILFKHCLFCTRTLLEEGRWNVCKGIAEMGLKIIEEHNKRNEQAINPYMIQANLFYARKMIKDKTVKSDIEAWDLNGAHDRYKFLQKILLDKFSEAIELAKNLIKPDDKGKQNMSFNEFQEWPILKEFRQSVTWIEFKEYVSQNEF